MTEKEALMVELDLSYCEEFLPENWLTDRLPRLSQGAAMLERGDGPGGDYTGWVHLPQDYDREEVTRLVATAQRLRETCQVFLVVGIGGSYLGARALMELLHSPHYNLTHTPQVFFTGNSLSPDALEELKQLIADKDFAINVISKSGSTIETSVAFLVFKELLEKKYGREGARERIIVTTDPVQGTLRALAEEEGYPTFAIPSNVGGRYSVLTPVGLLPLAVAGIDVTELLQGAADQRREIVTTPGRDNEAWRYAAARHALYEGGKRVEILACYEPSFRYFGEWWKQLFGESEGKEGKGLFPATVEFSADLHSMGQYIQDGGRFLLETVLEFASPRSLCPVPARPADYPPGDHWGLEHLYGRDLHFVNRQALRGTLLAHVDGGVPNLLLTATGRNPFCAGQLVYFFQYACALSGYLLEVNPFDQPGVEAYKTNMQALLGKPGLEEVRKRLEERLL